MNGTLASARLVDHQQRQQLDTNEQLTGLLPTAVLLGFGRAFSADTFGV